MLHHQCCDFISYHWPGYTQALQIQFEAWKWLKLNDPMPPVLLAMTNRRLQDMKITRPKQESDTKTKKIVATHVILPFLHLICPQTSFSPHTYTHSAVPRCRHKLLVGARQINFPHLSSHMPPFFQAVCQNRIFFKRLFRVFTSKNLAL